jgi:hypothetical protein
LDDQKLLIVPYMYAEPVCTASPITFKKNSTENYVYKFRLDRFIRNVKNIFV